MICQVGRARAIGVDDVYLAVAVTFGEEGDLARRGLSVAVAAQLSGGEKALTAVALLFALL